MNSNKIDPLTLISGVPVFLKELGISILQPKIKDIAILGERKFFKSMSYFFLEPKKMNLEKDVSAFDLFLLLFSQDVSIQREIADFLILTIEGLEEVKFFDSILIIIVSGHECIIDEPKFSLIKESLSQIFKINESADNSSNPANEAARKIAEKLKRRRELLSTKGSEGEQVLANLLSILATGSNSISMEQCLNLTIYQVYNLIERFNLYTQYNIQIQSMMQGAENVELVDWTKQI
jgi:hypothetical protein